MPLHDNHTYVLRNELTHTVLDLTGNPERRLFGTPTLSPLPASIMGWKWHGHDNQKAGDGALSVAIHADVCLLSGGPFKMAMTAGCSGVSKSMMISRASFLPSLKMHSPIKITALSEAYSHYDCRILYDDRAVSLVTGEKVHKIEARDVLFDLHADGPPIALQPWAENSAQIWLFHDLTDEFPTTGIWNPLTNGTYKIVNSKTGTVLDIEEYPGNPVHALASKGGNHHRWIVTLEGGSRTKYSFKSSANNNLFLAPETGDLGNGTALIGGTEKFFLVRKVPGTQLYKIFWGNSQLAVNIAVVDGEPDSAHGAVVSLQAAEAQTWYFVKY
ncbi:carbohydrate-binding module family 13 protein [Laccaria amethystina LaAM-08-1]|uniref:Carbohydrate-binding module family 13 protein n=1 Tax=Laccaria amethystina LaAM-08-1 TaxID=1095629 RepID=A0A0C9X6K4_9AGAR|nr:carbohydrate-binding module family 13 protein [Laccaria amethystina LaAM-08-1]